MPDGKETKQKFSAEELQEKLAAHQRWLDSDGEQGERLDLRGANLIMARLDGEDLSKAQLKGADFSGANLKWANLSYAHLEEADLFDAHLEGAVLLKAYLAGANLWKTHLSRANLRWAHLEGAILRRAHLEGADLYGAHLEGAYLKEAHLEGANCHFAKFDDAVLSSVIFEGEVEEEAQAEPSTETNPQPAESRAKKEKVTKHLVARNLSASQLARANLHQTVLPSKGIDFEPGLERVKEVTGSARNVFLSIIVACLFSWLTLANATDLALLINDKAFYLPIVNIDVPAEGFFVVAPIILLSVYVYLHVYLRMLWQACARLPARFPDGDTLEQRISPWLVGVLVSLMPRMPKQRNFFYILQFFIALVTTWLLVPGTLFWYWHRYLPVHSLWISTIQLTIALAATGLGFAFLFEAHKQLTGVWFPRWLRWFIDRLMLLPRWLGKPFFARFQLDCRNQTWLRSRSLVHSFGILLFLAILAYIISDHFVNKAPTIRTLVQEGHLADPEALRGEENWDYVWKSDLLTEYISI